MSDAQNNGKKYTLNELLVCALAAELRNDEMGFVGVGTGGRAFSLAVGIPLAASKLAQLTHAPTYSVQIGAIIDPSLDHIPSVFDENSISAWPAAARVLASDNLDMFVRGYVDVGFISGAQIDRFGNINITAIGDYEKPKVRLVGCLALPEHQAFAQRPIILADLNKRTFVENVDFVTGVGYKPRGGDSREAVGLKPQGAELLISNLAIFDFNGPDHMLHVRSLHPGVEPDQVRENLGFEIDIPGDVPRTPEPEDRQLTLIRDVIDPNNILLRH